MRQPNGKRSTSEKAPRQLSQSQVTRQAPLAKQQVDSVPLNQQKPRSEGRLEQLEQLLHQPYELLDTRPRSPKGCRVGQRGFLLME